MTRRNRISIAHNQHWEIPEFETLKKDLGLFIEFTKLNRFKMTHESGAGDYVSVAATVSLDNMITTHSKVVGVPCKYKNHDKRLNRGKTSQNEQWLRDTSVYVSWDDTYDRRYRFESDMFGHNIAYKSNAKVNNFFDKLKTKDRFTQHCIINGKDFNRETYDDWVDYVETTRYLDLMSGGY